MSIPATGEEAIANKKRKVEDVYDCFGKAVSCGFLENVKQLVEEGKVDVSSATFNNEQQILLSAGTNMVMIKYLVEKGAQVDINVVRCAFGDSDEATIQKLRNLLGGETGSTRDCLDIWLAVLQ